MNKDDQSNDCARGTLGNRREVLDKILNSFVVIKTEDLNEKEQSSERLNEYDTVALVHKLTKETRLQIAYKMASFEDDSIDERIIELTDISNKELDFIKDIKFKVYIECWAGDLRITIEDEDNIKFYYNLDSRKLFAKVNDSLTFIMDSDGGAKEI